MAHCFFCKSKGISVLVCPSLIWIISHPDIKKNHMHLNHLILVGSTNTIVKAELKKEKSF